MTPENLVVGGGLAGAMAGLRLARAGRSVVLLEKEPGAHHKVCGEFLSPEAVSYLRQAGLDPLRLGAAEIARLRFSVKDRLMETELPFRALSLSRCVLDAALLERAADAGCNVRSATAVQGIAREGRGWTARLEDGTPVQARNVFLATGKHDVRGWYRPAGRQGDLVGFKMHWRLRADAVEQMRGFMDLFLFTGGYGGLALVEGGAANLCLVIRRARLRQLGDWRAVLASIWHENLELARRLKGAVPVWERPLAIGSIPYGYFQREECGIWRVGDQAAVIPSFTGDGMAIALHSGSLAVGMYLAGNSPGEYRTVLNAQLRRGMRVATVLSQAMVSGLGRKLAKPLMPLLSLPFGWIAGLTRIPGYAVSTLLDKAPVSQMQSQP